MTIGDDGIASICMGKEHIGNPCERCGHERESVSLTPRRQFSFRAWSWALQNFYYFTFPDRGPETTYKELPNRVVQQFTELFDRAGVPIYEGDIVQRYPKEKYSPFAIKWSQDEGWSLPASEPPNQRMIDFEVIGNIYQNAPPKPELPQT